MFPSDTGLERLCACTDQGSLHFFLLHDDNSIEEKDEDDLSRGVDFCLPVSSHHLSHQQESRSVKSLLATGSSEAADVAHHFCNTVGATRSTVSPTGTSSSR
jgi:hypothetical protein